MRHDHYPLPEPTLDDKLVGELPYGTHLLAASQRTGRMLLTTEDANIDHQSPFDRQSRVMSAQPVSKRDFLHWIAQQVIDWTPSEIQSLHQIALSMQKKYEPLDFSLPERVYLVKTTGLVQGHAAYTRRHDTIVLPQNMVASLAPSAQHGDPLHSSTDITYLENVTIHESFHLFSKNNPDRRFALYDLIGYRSTGRAVELPNVPWPASDSPGTMPDLKVTNPDTPELNVYIELEVPEHPSDPHGHTVKRPLLPVLVARQPYAGGDFFEYFDQNDWWFLAIEEHRSGWAPMLDSSGRPLCYRSAPLMRQYFRFIGNNLTGELFHPDEVMAQNFVLLANEPSPGLLAKMRPILA